MLSTVMQQMQALLTGKVVCGSYCQLTRAHMICSCNLQMSDHEWAAGLLTLPISTNLLPQPMIIITVIVFLSALYCLCCRQDQISMEVGNNSLESLQRLLLTPEALTACGLRVDV